MRDDISIVIPVFKSELTENEKKSLIQCCKVFYQKYFTLVVPENLEVGLYENIFVSNGCNYIIQRFNNHFFNSIAGYNRLLLSREFYQRFHTFEYILIYQLDAYVFSDELTYWCKKGYDYIGAPLIGKFEDTEFSIEMRVGNGGFSLRKVKTYIEFFESGKNVFTPKQIAGLINIKKKPYTRWLVWLLMIMGWRNKPITCAKHWKYNEDDFWSGYMDRSNYALTKPTPSKALRFAFERFPKECYKITGKLPFGCHAWEKYQYEEFWIDFI